MRHTIFAILMTCALALWENGASAQPYPPGGLEVAKTLTVIAEICPANAARAVQGAQSSINAMPSRAGMAPITVDTTAPASFLDVYAQIDPDASHTTERELAKVTIDGMLSVVNPHDHYVDTTVCCERFGAIMVIIQSAADGVRVEDVPPGPAERAGVQPGDILISIDDQPTRGLALRDAAKLLKGPVGSVARLVIAREGVAEPVALNIPREQVTYPSVVWRLQDGVGVIAIRAFGEETGRLMRQAFRALRREGGAAVPLVIDVRNNSGGLLDTVMEVSDLFLDGGRIGSVSPSAYCPPQTVQPYNARNDRNDTRGMRLAVLINSGTGNGAELFAAALVERRGAIAIGQKTEADAQIQTHIPLSNRAAIRITTGELLTSADVKITGTGVTPAIETPNRDRAHDYALERALETLKVPDAAL